MNKILIEVFCPITNQTYDIYIPVGLVFGEIKILIARLIEGVTSSHYFQDNQIILCHFESGKIIKESQTPQELKMLNGHKIIIM